jgi:hypothetical protein
MPRITTADISNHDEANEASGYLASKGTFESHWPPKHKVSVSAPEGVASVDVHSLPLPPKSAPKADHVAYAVQNLGVSQDDAESMTVPELIAKARPEEDEEEGEETSAGSSSLTSESKPAKSGSSAPETEPLLPSPAPDAESPSGKGRSTKAVPSSSVSSTGTSTRGTGASQRSRQGSSAGSTDQTEATPGPGDDPK